MTRAISPVSQMDAWLVRVALDQPEIDTLVTLANTAIASEAQMTAPVDTGDLKASHFANPAEDGVGELGASMQYAQAVHETHPTKAGWFLDAINAHARTIYGRLIRDTLRRKGAR